MALSRRRLLAGSCAGTVVAVAGCASYFEGGVQLGGVSVANYDDEPRELEVRDGDSTVQASDVALPGADDASGSTVERTAVACNWGDEPGEFVVDARVADAERQSFAVADTVDEECVAVEIEVYPGDDVAFNTTACADLAPGRREPPWGCPFLES